MFVEKLEFFSVASRVARQAACKSAVKKAVGNLADLSRIEESMEEQLGRGGADSVCWPALHSSKLFWVGNLSTALSALRTESRLYS